MMLQSLQNTESRDCSVCFNETNGLKMDYHTYLKYAELWQSEQKVENQPLIKCIKCTYYTCKSCKWNCNESHGGCPQNCHNIGQPKTICHPDHVYYEFGVYRHLNYANQRTTELWLAQFIYEQQENPRPELLIYSSIEQVNNALLETKSLFDQILVNIQDQTISGYIKLPFEQELILIKYPVYLLIQHSVSFKYHNPQELLQNLKIQFKADICKFFERMSKPGFIDPWEEIHKFNKIKPENYPDYNKSAFEWGYTVYIKQALQNLTNDPVTIVKCISESDVISSTQQISLETGVIGAYVIQSVEYIDFGIYPEVKSIQNSKLRNQEYRKLRTIYKENLKYATPAEFDEFFKDCKELQQQ